MRKQDIVKGGIYWDGNMGVRKVLDIGPQYKQFSHRADRDCLQFQILSDCVQGIRKSRFDEKAIRVSARQTFATWAQERVTDDHLGEVMETIQARCMKLRPSVAQALIEAGRKVSSRKTSIKRIRGTDIADEPLQQLQKQGLVQVLPNPHRASADIIFTPLGLKVLAHLSQEQSPRAAEA